MKYTSKYNICHCFSCGVNYDIFDLIAIDYNISSFNNQLKKVQEIYPNNGLINYNSYHSVDKEKYDYTNYYNRCFRNINKINYLQGRGISSSLIDKYKIGYDEKRKLVVFPINKYCYFARSIINNDKIKSPGSSDIWNKELLKDNNSILYVTEGIIDSLSLEVIDPHVKTVSVNGVGNIHTLISIIKKNSFDGVIAIVFDDDSAGQRASKNLKEELAKINVSSFSISLTSNIGNIDCNDINKALLTDKKKLEKNYEYVNHYMTSIIEQKKLKKEENLEIG